MIYCAIINKESVYRNYSNDRIAISRFKLIAIEKYGKLTDISKKINGKWSRIEF